MASTVHCGFSSPAAQCPCTQSSPSLPTVQASASDEPLHCVMESMRASALRSRIIAPTCSAMLGTHRRPVFRPLAAASTSSSSSSSSSLIVIIIVITIIIVIIITVTINIIIIIITIITNITIYICICVCIYIYIYIYNIHMHSSPVSDS